MMAAPEDLENLTERVEAMGDNVERVADQVLAGYEAGALDLAMAIAALGIIVQTANRQALTVAAASVATTLRAAGLEPADLAPVSAMLSRRLDRDRLTDAVRVVMADEDPAPALHRLARTEVAHTARQAQAAAVDSAPASTRRRIVGWRRRLDSDPCETCRAWADGGRVLPYPGTMATHPNCGCTRELVYADEGEK